MNIPIGPGDIPVKIGRFVRGLALSALLLSLPDAGAVQTQTSTVTFGGSTDAATYTITIASTTVGVVFSRAYSVVAPGSSSAAGMAALLLAALEDDADLGRLVSSRSASGAVITLVGAGNRTFSIALTANPSTHMTSATTAPGYQTYLYGRAVEITSTGVRKPVLPTRGAMLYTIDTHNNAQTVSSTISLLSPGPNSTISQRLLSFASGASAAAHAEAARAALAALFPEASVAITTADTVVTVTLPPGYSATRSPLVTGTVVATLTASLPAALPEIGIVHCDQVTPAQESWTGPTEVLGPIPGSLVQVWAPGGAYVEHAVAYPASAPTFNAPVYCDANGVLHSSVAADRILIPGLRWRTALDSNVAVLGG